MQWPTPTFLFPLFPRRWTAALPHELEVFGSKLCGNSHLIFEQKMVETTVFIDVLEL